MLKMLWTILFVILSVATACKSTQATPTPTVTTLSWATYSDPAGKGFWMYWRDQGVVGSTYNNTNRTQITDITKVSVLISAIVAATHPSSMCFVLTAFDAANNETQFSNEACGFVGFTTPTALVSK